MSTGTANKREAERCPALRLSEVEQEKYVKPARITFAELGQQFMDHAKANKRLWLRDQQILKHLKDALYRADSQARPLSPKTYRP